MQIDNEKLKKKQRDETSYISRNIVTKNYKISSSSTVKTAFHSIYLTFEIEMILDYSSFICFGQDIGKLNK